jgi:hypothetical protein
LLCGSGPVVVVGCIVTIVTFVIVILAHGGTVGPGRGPTAGVTSRCVEDEIRKLGAMDVMISDRARSQISKKLHDVL